MSISVEARRREWESAEYEVEDSMERDIAVLFADFYRRKTGEELSEGQKRIVRELAGGEEE